MNILNIYFTSLFVGLAFFKAKCYNQALYYLTSSSIVYFEVYPDYFIQIWVDPQCKGETITGGHIIVGVINTISGDISNKNDSHKAVKIWRTIGKGFIFLCEHFFNIGDKLYCTSTSDSRDKLYKRVGFVDTKWTMVEEINGVLEDRPILLHTVGEKLKIK